MAFVYEYSELSWRDIPDKFCDEKEKIAHSTLYRAVHGLGKGIFENGNKIQDAINALRERYLKDLNRDVLPKPWPLEKSLYDHTKKREAGVRLFLTPFLIAFDSEHTDFLRLFYAYIRAVKTILSNADPPVCKIYTK